MKIVKNLAIHLETVVCIEEQLKIVVKKVLLSLRPAVTHLFKDISKLKGKIVPKGLNNCR